MFGSRTNCIGCHTEMATTEHAGSVVQATLSGCIACHGDRHAETFEKWKLGLELTQTDADKPIPKLARRWKRPTTFPESAAEGVGAAHRGSGRPGLGQARQWATQRGAVVDGVLDSVTQRAQASALLSETARAVIEYRACNLYECMPLPDEWRRRAPVGRLCALSKPHTDVVPAIIDVASKHREVVVGLPVDAQVARCVSMITSASEDRSDQSAPAGEGGTENTLEPRFHS
jgi:hypothetical protein